MSKRGAIGEITDEDRAKPIKMSKPSLDSDEEDYKDEEECSRLREADIDGQEKATLEYDDDIKITPFNMKEELEEDGYFDGSGTFIFKKSTDARDNWLEDVDWVEVNRRQHTNQPTNTAISDEPPAVPLGKDAKVELYQQLLRLLRPKETVLQSIKRMGAGSDAKQAASASQRWLKKKKQTVVSFSEQGDPEGLVRATELADQLLQAGEFDVYQMTIEDIDLLLKQSADRAEDDELDALGQALDQKGDERNGTTGPTGEAASNGTSSEDKPNPDDSTETVVMWHLKRSETADAECEGPYSTQQLRQWMNQGKFVEDKCILVRQVDKPNGQFYNVHRIDFDLYE